MVHCNKSQKILSENKPEDKVMSNKNRKRSPKEEWDYF